MYKVFLVDDEIVIREGIRNSFPWEENGFTLVGEAPDGELALQTMQDVKPDILITDIRMPFMDGMQLCEAVSHTMPWVQIVILSGYDDFTYAQQAISLGVKEYLLKPVSAQELLEVLERIAGRIREERRAQADLLRIKRQLASSSAFLREKLLSDVWGFDFYGDDRTVDTHIKMLRGSLGEYRKFIVTLRGLGYKFEA